jgi:ion channel-forming bestrophin family protein
MVLYNPKEWWKIIFAFHKSESFKMMTPGLIGVFVYTGIICYIENEVLHVTFKNTTAVHSLVGLVLSLLLVFRTNTAYDRWWEGRRIWGAITNDARGLFIKLNSMLLSHQDDVTNLKNYIISYAYALKLHLRKMPITNEVIFLDDDDIEKFETAHNPPLIILSELQKSIQRLVHDEKLNNLQLLYVKDEIKSLVDSVGACERIRNTPIPFSYNMFIKKVIFMYIFTMPIGFVREFEYWAMPIVTCLFYVFASIELIAEEIEDPFGSDSNDLPLDLICDNLNKHLTEIQNAE